MSGRSLERWVDETAAGLEHVGEVAEDALRRLGDRARDEIRRLAPRARGDLQRSIEVRHGEHEVELMSDHPAAALLEQGGMVRGQPWLAIPLGAVGAVAGPRSDPADLFVLKSKDGRLFLASRSSGALQLRWRLAREISISPQPFFGPGLEAAREGFERELADDVARTIQGGRA